MRTHQAAVKKEKLSDTLARAVNHMIDSGGYETGDRLPTIAEMADMYQVGAPTLREALKKLQAAGIIHIRHGAGVFVAEHHDALFVHNPVADRQPSKQVIIEMLEARLAVEPYTAGLAAERATGDQIERMGEILDEAREALTKGDRDAVAEAGLSYHRQIAMASQNNVISQLLALISGLFQTELYTVLDLYGNTERDYREHRSILAAIAKRNRSLAVRRMRRHISNVRVAIERYYDEQTDVVTDQ